MVHCHFPLLPFTPTTIIGIIIATLLTIPNYTNALLLLSDLPTPSFIIDTQALLRRHSVAASPLADDVLAIYSSRLPPSIRCPKNGILLRPSRIVSSREIISTSSSTKTTYPTTTTVNAEAEADSESIVLECEFEVIEGQPSVGYIHTSVVRAREDVIPGVDPVSTFLAEVDVGCDLCGGGARLVLGLNNHHVGSYYWARSAGAGSSMEAPGISFCGSAGGTTTVPSRGILRWVNEEGPEACNSNDGKRSEWVNFLRTGDTVQFVPMDGQDSILRFSKRFGISTIESTESDTDMVYSAPMKDDDHATWGRSIRVFGISSQGRPMGSEPEVICEWTVT
jgi:hypothetical protein